MNEYSTVITPCMIMVHVDANGSCRVSGVAWQTRDTTRHIRFQQRQRRARAWANPPNKAKIVKSEIRVTRLRSISNRTPRGGYQHYEQTPDKVKSPVYTRQAARHTTGGRGGLRAPHSPVTRLAYGRHTAGGSVVLVRILVVLLRERHRLAHRIVVVERPPKLDNVLEGDVEAVELLLVVRGGGALIGR